MYRRCKFDLKYLISFSWMLHITFHYTINPFFILQIYLLQLRPTIHLVIMVSGYLLFFSKECGKIESSSLLKKNVKITNKVFFFVGVILRNFVIRRLQKFPNTTLTNPQTQSFQQPLICLIGWGKTTFIHRSRQQAGPICMRVQQAPAVHRKIPVYWV